MPKYSLERDKVEKDFKKAFPEDFEPSCTLFKKNTEMLSNAKSPEDLLRVLKLLDYYDYPPKIYGHGYELQQREEIFNYLVSNVPNQPGSLEECRITTEENARAICKELEENKAVVRSQARNNASPEQPSHVVHQPKNLGSGANTQYFRNRIQNNDSAPQPQRPKGAYNPEIPRPLPVPKTPCRSAPRNPFEHPKPPSQITINNTTENNNQPQKPKGAR